MKPHLRHASCIVVLSIITAALAAGQPGRDTFVVTSTNGSPANQVVVFKLTTSPTPALSMETMFPTDGAGGAAGGSAGAVQFKGDFGAVANFGSHNVTQLLRFGNSITSTGNINLAANCQNPVSVAIADGHLFVLGSNCAESHAWPVGTVDGSLVTLTDPSGAQIAAGETWAAATLTSGSVLQLPLDAYGALSGVSTAVMLPADADNTPLGAAFWENLLAFNPAHSPDSFALLTSNGTLTPVAGPTPPYPTNAPCWIVKGPGSLWYTANSPAHAISIFFSDGQGGVFYKSIALAGAPTDVAVSRDKKWFAVIYTATDNSGAHIAVFSIDRFGDLTLAATSPAIGVAAFDGVAFSE
jgi:hypothetical protein